MAYWVSKYFLYYLSVAKVQSEFSTLGGGGLLNCI